MRGEEDKTNAKVSIGMFFFTDRQQIQLSVSQAVLHRPEGGDPDEG